MYTQEEFDSIVSQLDELSGGRPLFYLKFCSEPNYAEDVLNGKLFANTPKYFRELERRTRKRGQGDEGELTLTVDANELNAFDTNTGDLSFSLSDVKLKVKYNDDDSTPIVCFVGMLLKDMKFVSADDTHAEFDFPFTQEEYDKIESDFGKHCVIIGARELERRIAQTCKNNDVEYLFEPVKYVVPNSIEKMMAYANCSNERFLYKDLDLSFQREYRLAIDGEIPKDHYIPIGKLKSAKVIDSAALRSLRFSINYTSSRSED